MRSARSASCCLSTSRPWTPSTWGEGAAASTWFAAGDRRGHVRNFASGPIEDSDIFGAGGAQGIDTCVKTPALTPSTLCANLTFSVRLLPVVQVHEQGVSSWGVEHQGNVFLYQELSLLWAVENLEDVTPDALIAAHAINPPPDLLIVGCGDKIGTLPKATLEFFHDTETTLEVLDTVRSRTLPGLSVAPADT